jgi:pyruvate,water dikinase
MNDLFLMLSHGALRRVADHWLGPEARSLVNAVLVQGTVASAQPGRDLVQVAATIRARSDWSGPIMSARPEQLPALLDTEPGLAGVAALINGYLDRWGDLAPRELQLERPTYRDDPVPLLRALQALVGAPPVEEPGSSVHARARIRGRLLAHPRGPIRLLVFLALLGATRRHIRWREEMRLDRGQVFGVGRRIFRRIGEVLAEQGTLEHPEDVHYLSVHELRGMIRGTAVVGDPRGLVRMRRGLYEDYAVRARLPTRFETRGPITDPLAIHPPAGPTAPTAPTTPTPVRAWSGIGAAQGRVTGPCLVVRDPAAVTLLPGHIIAAHTTDPGWVPLLVGAAGLLVEQGGLLSHSAIVARELGIPTVLGLAGLLDTVRTGDMVELDGATGEVTLLAMPGGPP